MVFSCTAAANSPTVQLPPMSMHPVSPFHGMLLYTETATVMMNPLYNTFVSLAEPSVAKRKGELQEKHD